ncbi:hypothetical protein JTB14_028262 [Gonioctena quinquepunctata]|nr:hypothetical protein JTB14_028262 [Gonioctena quinquepunctata]
MNSHKITFGDRDWTPGELVSIEERKIAETTQEVLSERFKQLADESTRLFMLDENIKKLLLSQEIEDEESDRDLILSNHIEKN